MLKEILNQEMSNKTTSMKSDWKVAKIALVSNENLQSRFQKARGKKVHFFFGNCHTQQYYGKRFAATV